MQKLSLSGIALACLLGFVAIRPARADMAPKWTDRELASFSQIVLTGRVTDVSTGWDGDTLYTYVSVDVADVVKGWLPERHIVIKQLGGRSGDLALVIGGQASFVRGEEILAFLEVRPRDRTLSTTALWQGKWTIRPDAVSGERVAVRSVPGARSEGIFGSATDARPVASFLAQVRASSPADGAAVEVNPNPRELRDATPVQAVDAASIFAAAWQEEARSGAPVRVETQSGGRSALAGGGGDAILRAAQDAAAAAGTTAADGGTRSAGCFTSFSNRASVFVSSGDACGEMSTTGGTIAVSGAWVNAAAAGTATNRPFMQILSSGVIHQNRGAGLAYLTNAACFQTIVRHELGHAMGLRDGPASTPLLDRNCSTPGPSIVLPAGALRATSSPDARTLSQGAAVAAASTFVTTRISVTSAGSEANGPSSIPTISADGRFILFGSMAPNVTGEPTSTTPQPLWLMLRDTQTGSTLRIGVSRDSKARITPDGRFVVYSQLGTPDGSLSAFDRLSLGTTLITIPGHRPVVSVSNDLRYAVAAEGAACNSTVTLFDRQTANVSTIPPSGSNTDVEQPVLSPDGRYIAYSSCAGADATRMSTYIYDQTTGLAVAAGNGTPVAFNRDNHYLLLLDNGGVGVMVFDMVMARIVFVSPGSNFPAISSNGRYVTFVFPANGGAPNFGNVYTYDQQAAQQTVTSVSSDGTAGNGNAFETSVDDSGRVVYRSSATNLVPSDTNASDDVFLSVPGPTPPPSATPGPPTNLTSNVSGSGNTFTVTLNWTAPAGGAAPTFYMIEAGSAPGGTNLANIQWTAGTTFTAIVGGSGTFFVRVRSGNSAGVSAPSNEIVISVGGSTPPELPGAPSNLQISASGSTVTLTWAAPASGGPVTTYVVRAGSNSGSSNLANFATGSTATSFTATGVPAGTYFVRVLASNSSGVGAASNEVAVILVGGPACAAPPGAPASLVSSVTGSTLRLSWSAGTGAAQAFVITAASASAGSTAATFDTASAATSLTATGIGPGTYVFNAQGENACGTSAASDETTVVVP